MIWIGRALLRALVPQVLIAASIDTARLTISASDDDTILAQLVLESLERDALPIVKRVRSTDLVLSGTD